MQNGRIFAHRGLKTLAPENTMAAFRLASKYGLTWCETDVDIIADSTVIICHDSTLDRTTDTSGSIYDLTRADLENIDAGAWFAPEFRGERIPTLAEFVAFMNESGMNANIEIKANECGKTATLRLIDGVIAELEKLKPGREVIVSSFSHVLLAIFKKRAPKLPVGCLFESCALYADWKSVLELVGADYLHPEDLNLTEDRVQMVLRAGFGINVWTVNDLDRISELFNWGVSGVFTDIAHLVPKSDGTKIGR